MVFAGEGVVGGAVDQVDVEPAVVVVVDQADAGAVGLDDEVLLRACPWCGSRWSRPAFCGDVLKDDRAGFDEAAGGDGAVLAVEDRRVGAAGVDAMPMPEGLAALGRGTALHRSGDPTNQEEAEGEDG